MEYLKIQNWDRWQTYRKDRGQPPWIKIHRRIRLNPEWVELSDSERGQLVSIWLLAADKDGVVPDSKELIKKLCFMSGTPNLNKFIDLGFIENGRRQNDAGATPERQPDVTPKAEAKAEAKADKNIYMDFVFLTNSEFEKLKTDFGEKNLNLMVEELSLYLGADKKRQKKYSSHNHVLRGWVAEKLGFKKGSLGHGYTNLH